MFMKQKLFDGFLKVCLVWVIFALSFQTTMLTLSYTKPELAKKISNELSWKFDGTFNK